MTDQLASGITNAELAAEIREEVACPGSMSASRLELVARRLEAREEISDSTLDRAVTAAREWLPGDVDEVNVRHAVGAALDAAREV